jgi:Transposase DDE domain group 1
MQTECSADLFGFAPVEGRKVVAAFDGGRMTSEAGALLLGATDGQLRLVERFAGCFTDCRAAELVEHTVARLVGQRVFGMALGYEDLIDHDQLRHDPVMAVLGGKLSAKRADCAPLAGKSTLNRLELSRPERRRCRACSRCSPASMARMTDCPRPLGCSRREPRRQGTRRALRAYDTAHEESWRHTSFDDLVGAG